MGRKCAVPHCYTGYRKCKEKASLYRVPDDDFFLTKWQEAIARDDRPITPKDYVCEKHFKDDDILRKRIIKDVVEVYQRPRLKPDAIPSIFPELPEFILKMVKKRRKMPMEEPKSTETSDISLNKSDNSNIEENATEEDITEKEVKSEPIDLNEANNVATAMCETILSNEIEIKSEPDEHIDHSDEKETGNERDDPCFGPKMHQCDQCEYQTKYPHNLRTHKTKHLTGEAAYIRCEHCPHFKTKWDITYRNHLKIKHGIGKQEIFKCKECNFKTKVKLCLKRHSERHQKCDHTGCTYKTENKGILDLHKLSHVVQKGSEIKAMKSKNFKCTECLYETNSKVHIIKHIKSNHSSGDDTIVSVNIKKKANTQTENVSKDKALYKCLKCSYRSKSHSLLVKHLFKHKHPETMANQKKCNVWKCGNCPYVTFFQHALQRHQEMECRNIFVCKECDFQSNHKADFIKHSLTHNNVIMEKVQDFSNGNIENEGKNLNESNNSKCDEDEMNNVPEFVTVKSEIPDMD